MLGALKITSCSSVMLSINSEFLEVQYFSCTECISFQNTGSSWKMLREMVRDYQPAPLPLIAMHPKGRFCAFGCLLPPSARCNSSSNSSPPCYTLMHNIIINKHCWVKYGASSFTLGQYIWLNMLLYFPHFYQVKHSLCISYW